MDEFKRSLVSDNKSSSRRLVRITLIGISDISNLFFTSKYNLFFIQDLIFLAKTALAIPDKSSFISITSSMF